MKIPSEKDVPTWTHNQEIYHIDQSGTIIVTDQTAFLEWFLVTVTNTGTNWMFAIQSRQPVPMCAVPPIALAKAGINQQTQMYNPDPPRLLWMEGGMDIVAGPGTPGIIDVWITWYKPPK